MPHRIFYSVDLAAWVDGTIEKHRQDGASWPWRRTWIETYEEIGGRAEESGKKSCPMTAAKILYEYGRIKDCDKLPKDCDITELWKRRDGGKNGTYAILATRLLRADSHLSKTSLWREIRQAVKRKFDYEAPKRDNDAMRVTYQLWRLGLIVDVSV